MLNTCTYTCMFMSSRRVQMVRWRVATVTNVLWSAHFRRCNHQGLRIYINFFICYLSPFFDTFSQCFFIFLFFLFNERNLTYFFCFIDDEQLYIWDWFSRVANKERKTNHSHFTTNFLILMICEYIRETCVLIRIYFCFVFVVLFLFFFWFFFDVIVSWKTTFVVYIYFGSWMCVFVRM